MKKYKIKSLAKIKKFKIRKIESFSSFEKKDKKSKTENLKKNQNFQNLKKNENFQKNEKNLFFKNFENFEIPELPKCKGVIINFFDLTQNKIFLNKIQIFNKNGKLIKFDFFFEKKKIQKNFLIFENFEKKNEISLIFKNEEILSLIRIFKNKKNLKNQKIGISNLKKNKLFFFGKIKKKNFETILFTIKKEILEKISKNDFFYKKKKNFENLKNSKKKKIEKKKLKNSLNSEISEIISDSSFFDFSENSKKNNFKKLKIIIKKNWGDEKNFGFRKIEIYKKNDILINPKNFKILTNINSKLKKKNFSENSEKIFLKKKNFNYFLEFFFLKEIQIKYIKIENLENGKALKNILIFKNDKLLTNSFGFIIKKNNKENFFSEKIFFPFFQNFFFNNKKNKNFISGFFLEIKFISNFGDNDFIGIQNLQIFNFQNFDILKKKKFQINFSKKIENEKNLENFEKKKNLENFENKFLLKKNEKNSIFLNFENPQFLKKIKIENLKNKKSVKEIILILDGFIIFHGFLKNYEINEINFDQKFLEFKKHYKSNINLINEKII